jgi:hypothetical protein
LYGFIIAIRTGKTDNGGVQKPKGAVMENGKNGILVGWFYQIFEQVLAVGTEYAGHSVTDRAKVGRYPVVIKNSPTGGRYLSICLDAVRVNDSFFNRIGASGFMREGETGQDVPHSLQPYCYQIAEMAALGVVELAEGFGWESKLVDDYRGEKRPCYSLTRDGKRVIIS